jgi:CheY-like chemotaxis protein
MPDNKAQILIVDDEASIRTMMSLVLSEIGYHVRSVEDGFSALREIRQKIPDILLSDLNMPGMSGFELLSVVRRRFPEVMVVAMSGAFSGNEVPSGIHADAFYQKGSSMSALLRILSALPQLERRAPQPCHAVVPLWIQRNEFESSGKVQITITCPECLRAFSQALDGFGSLKREVDCVHCGNPVQCVIVEPSDQMMQKPFLLKARGPNLALNASN